MKQAKTAGSSFNDKELFSVLFDNYLIWVIPCFELLLHVWVGQPLGIGYVLALVGFGVCQGAVLSLIGRLFPGISGKIYAAVVGLLVAVIFVAQYLINDAFQTFMNPSQILSGAGGVMSGFMDVVAVQLKSNAVRILMLLVPTVVYLIFGKPLRRAVRIRFVPVLATCVLGLAVGVVGTMLQPGGLSTLGSSYEYGTCVKKCGVSAAFAMELTGGKKQSTLPGVSVSETTAPTEEVKMEETEGALTAEPAVVETKPVVYAPHTMQELDFAELAQTAGKIEYRNLSEYIAAREPAMENQYTGLFKGKNLILITAEAFSTQVIDPERTPTLYRLANQGIKFTDYYQPLWNGSTTSGEISILSGLVPELSGSMLQYAAQKPFNTMGWQLRNLGYFSRSYHNNDCNFYKRTKTHENIGYEKFIAMFNGMEEGVENVWPQSDLEMIDFTVPQYINNQPFSIYYMTVSGHSVYTLDTHAQARKNWDAVADMDAADPIKVYHAANLELEKAMASLVKQLEDAGIADDTVIVMSADHYPYGLDNGTAWSNRGNLMDEFYGVTKPDFFTRDSSALIIWSGCIEDKGITVEKPVSALDILPTLSNLFGVSYDSRMTVGRDVLGDEEAIVMWPNYSWVTELGRYNATTKKFTANEGVEVPEGYVSRIQTEVRGRIDFSHKMQSTGFLGYLTDLVNKIRSY